MPTGLKAVAYSASIFSYLPEIQIIDVVTDSSSVMPQKNPSYSTVEKLLLTHSVRVDSKKHKSTRSFTIDTPV